MLCWLDLIGKLVFMSAGISDLKQSQAGGLSKDLRAEGFNGLLPFFMNSPAWGPHEHLMPLLIIFNLFAFN